MLTGAERCSFRVVTGDHLLRINLERKASRLGERIRVRVAVFVDTSMDACQRTKLGESAHAAPEIFLLFT